MGLLFCSKLSAALRNQLAKGVVLAGIVTTTATGVAAGLEQQRKLEALERELSDAPATSVSADQPGDPAGDASAVLEEMGVVPAPQAVQPVKTPGVALPQAELLTAPAESVSPEEITPPVMAAMEQFNEMDDLLSAAERKELLEEDAAAKQGTPPVEAPPPDPPPPGVPGEERQDLAFQGDVWENPAYGNGGGSQYFIPHAKELKENALEGNSDGGRLIALKREWEPPGEARPGTPGEGVRSFQQDGRHVLVDSRPLTQGKAAELAQMEKSLPEDLSTPPPQTPADPELLSPEEIRELEAATIDTRGLNRIQGDVRQEDYLRPHSNQEDGGFLPDGWKNPSELQDGQVFYQLSTDGDTPSSYFTDEQTVERCRREDGSLDFNKLRDQLQVKDGMDKGCLTKYVYQAPQSQQAEPPSRDQDLDDSPPDYRADDREHDPPPPPEHALSLEAASGEGASYPAGTPVQEVPENSKLDSEQQQGPEVPAEAFPEERGEEDPTKEAQEETQGDSYAQENPADREETADQEEATEQEESTNQEETAEQEETTDQEESADQEESTDLEETADQEESTDQEEATEQKETADQEESTDQEKSAEQEETSEQEETTDQEEAADQEESTDQEETAEQGETTQEAESASWEKPQEAQDGQSQVNSGEVQETSAQNPHPWQRSSDREEVTDQEESADQEKSANQEETTDQEAVTGQEETSDQQETSGWEKGTDQQETFDQAEASDQEKAVSQKASAEQEETAGQEERADQEEASHQAETTQEAKSPSWEKPQEAQDVQSQNAPGEVQEASAQDSHPWQRSSDQEEATGQEATADQEKTTDQQEAADQGERADQGEASHEEASAGDTSQSTDNERGCEY